MVGNVGNIVNSALLNQLLSSKQTTELIDEVQLRLATGRKLNKVIDDPINFFASRSLQNTAADYSRLLDGIGQDIRALEETAIGLEATERLLRQAEAVVETSRDFLIEGDVDPAVFEEIVDVSPDSLSQQILQARPDVYFRLNETGGPIIDSGFGAAGPVGANYAGGASPGAAALYDNGSAPSVQFDGVNDRIRVDDSTMINLNATPARTVELVFNADDVSGRQILFEEGATVNGITIYIDDGLVYVTAEDDSGGNRFADININAPIVAGQTYHVALVLDAPANTFRGYLDGVEIGMETLAGDGTFPSHSGDIGIGGMNGGAQFHDGESGGGNGFNFAGRISDVAIYNVALDESVLASHANSLSAATSTLFFNRDYEAIISQLDDITLDANYRGANLLRGESLVSIFSPDGRSRLETKGQDFSTDGLGLLRNDFNDINDVDNILDAIEKGIEEVESYASTLSTNISVLQVRSEFTREKINVSLAGSDDLTLSDQNQDGAELLSLQTRQALGVTALSLGAQSQQAVLQLF